MLEVNFNFPLTNDVFLSPNYKTLFDFTLAYPWKYKSILTTIVELGLNLCFMATLLSMSAWNNGRGLNFESGELGSILALGEIFFLIFVFFFPFWATGSPSGPLFLPFFSSFLPFCILPICL